jgi:hypothetical protein
MDIEDLIYELMLNPELTIEFSYRYADNKAVVVKIKDTRTRTVLATAIDCGSLVSMKRIIKDLIKDNIKQLTDYRKYV